LGGLRGGRWRGWCWCRLSGSGGSPTAPCRGSPRWDGTSTIRGRRTRRWSTGRVWRQLDVLPRTQDRLDVVAWHRVDVAGVVFNDTRIALRRVALNGAGERGALAVDLHPGARRCRAARDGVLGDQLLGLVLAVYEGTLQ